VGQGKITPKSKKEIEILRKLAGNDQGTETKKTARKM